MKFYRHLVTAGAFGALAVIPACAEEAGPSSKDGPGIEVKIAPVTYLNALDVCWGFSVHNPAGELVAQQQNICAGDYGNGAGGDIAYVIPCDASQTGDSTVTLWLEGIQTAAGAPGPATFEDEDNYINPCGLTEDYLEWDNVLGNGPEFPTADLNFDSTYCQRKIRCLPNADVQVSFNLTILRDAQQGFFDIIVDFEDIFCSAKLDTCYSNTGNQIELLFDRDGDVEYDENDPGPRDATAVMALGCRGGPDTYDTATGVEKITTTLHYSNVGLVCNGDGANQIAIPLDPTGTINGAGNQAAIEYFIVSGGAIIGGPFVLASPLNYALYWGKETLPCGYYEDPDTDEMKPLSCNKKYWNIAVNLEDLEELGFTNCTLQGQATATSSDGLQLVNGQLDGVGVSYAAITFQDQVLAGGDPTCDWNPLNGENSDEEPSGVQTGYFGTDIVGIKNIQVMCYGKNSVGEGAPYYTQFVDRYTALGEGKRLGRLGTDFKGDVGGSYGKNCYKATPVQSAIEIGEWDIPAGIASAVFTFEKGEARPSEGNEAQIYGYNGQNWTEIWTGNALALENDGKGVNLGGYSRVALRLTGTVNRLDFRIHSLGSSQAIGTAL